MDRIVSTAAILMYIRGRNVDLLESVHVFFFHYRCRHYRYYFHYRYYYVRCFVGRHDSFEFSTAFVFRLYHFLVQFQCNNRLNQKIIIKPYFQTTVMHSQL